MLFFLNTITHGVLGLILLLVLLMILAAAAVVYDDLHTGRCTCWTCGRQYAGSMKQRARWFMGHDCATGDYDG